MVYKVIALDKRAITIFLINNCIKATANDIINKIL